MFAELKAALERAASDLLHHYDRGLLRLPQVRRRFDELALQKWKAHSYADDRTIDRLCGEIRAIGEELFRLGGIDRMRWAIGSLEWRAVRAIETIWHDIGGVWSA
jgi:hypothetical protein